MNPFAGNIITPENRNELERSVAFVAEDSIRIIDSGDDFAIGSFMTFTKDSLQKVSTLPNGRINLLSIENPLRLHGNMLITMEEEK